MRRPAALALVLLAAAAACTKVDTTAGAGGRHPWTTPGVLRIASLNDPDTLSPLVGTYQIDTDLSMFWAGYLFNYSDRNELVPELATTVPTLANGGIARDGRTITYHLRKGVTWQDGAPFDARDVVFTWQAVMNPNNDVGSRVGYDDVTRIDTPDAYTAVVHLKQPFAPFVGTFFTMAATAYPVYPRHLLARYHDLNRVAYNSAPVGTGPFKVLEWHRGQVIRMVANPHYWRGPPKLKEVDYTVIPDDNTMLTQMQSHAVDFWYLAPATLYRDETNIPGTRAVVTPFTQYSRIGFNLSRPIMSDVDVRRALAMATDRRHLIDTVTYGVNVLGEADQPKFLWAYDPNLRPWPYDPVKANALLDGDGWNRGADGIRIKNGTRLRIEIANITGSAVGGRMAVLLQAAWRRIGVDAEIKNYTSSLMLASYGAGGILQTGKFDVDFSSWINGIDPDDSTNVMCDQKPPAGQNTYRFCDRTLDAEERIALRSYDQATRKRAYAKIQEILVDRVPFLTVWFLRRIDVVNDDLHGYKPAHAVTTFWNTWEYSI
ncbi:MAG TPA: peptide ABC transporter substrate-binding protein [Candidatus Elarobacter sp.]|jgi:peptide/nickel transport system substrate-binding protein|nr:peptide ABC transporter substrate-binding protein [Candidatus Elarobacter sp.]